MATTNPHHTTTLSHYLNILCANEMQCVPSYFYGLGRAGDSMPMPAPAHPHAYWVGWGFLGMRARAWGISFLLVITGVEA